MKKYKQADHIYKPYLYTLFVNFFLFTLTGSIYGLITGGIGNLLLLPFYVGFAACATFSVYKACSVIYNNTTHRRSSKVIKNEAAFSPNKSLEPEDLIDLSDQPILNEEQESNPYTEEILTPEVVQDVRRNNKSNLVLSLNDKDYGSQQPPRASQAHGTGSFVSTSPTNQAASRSIRSIPKPYLAGGLEDLLQPQNVTSPIKPTVPTPPPMPAAINDESKVSFQSQNMNDSIIPTPPIFPPLSSDASQLPQLPSPMSTAINSSIIPTPPPLPPLPGDASQLPPPPPPMPESNLFTNKPEAESQEIKIQSDEPIPSSRSELSDELLRKARESLKKVDSEREEKIKRIEQDPKGMTAVMQQAFNNISTRDNDSSSSSSQKKNKEVVRIEDADNKKTKESSLNAKLEQRKQVCVYSDSDNDSIPDSDEWGGENVEPPFGIQDNSEPTKDNPADSGISSGEGSLEKVSNNTEEMQKPNSLFRSSSLSNLNGIEESQKLSNLSHSFSF